MQNIKDYVIEIRRKIHQNPELGFEEFETQKLIISELDKMNVKYHLMPEKTGIVASLGLTANNQKNILMFRADMDALPICEESNKEYCSIRHGKMHACGHDAHIAIMLGLIKTLTQSTLTNPIKVIFQPNEEGIGGAKFMIDNNVLEPKPQAIFGVHVKPDLPTGTLGFKYGAMMASVDDFEVKLIGKGGHGAMPEKTPDVISIGSKIINQIYEIIPENINKDEKAVLTCCQINAGTAFNIMPKELEIKGTIRTLNEKTRKIIHKKLFEIIKQEADKNDIKFYLEINKLVDVLNNDEELVKKAVKIAKQNKNNKIKILKETCMGGEDFADYLKFVKGCYVYLGTGNKTKKTTENWHSPNFDIDEESLIVAVDFFADVARFF